MMASKKQLEGIVRKRLAAAVDQRVGSRHGSPLHPAVLPAGAGRRRASGVRWLFEEGDWDEIEDRVRAIGGIDARSAQQSG
ncbi:hypothetical protein NL676_030452 [Syzygium grande]|nr:hypothetical protein NL676_030452 [Syzygium grande]